MENIKKEFFNHLLSLAPLRGGPDFYEGESDSLICLGLLLNQRVGVERATSASLAIHYYFGKPITELHETVSKATLWPYRDRGLRSQAKSLIRIVAKQLDILAGPENVFIDELPASAVGALASLERYYNRENTFFDPIRKIELEPETIRSITLKKFREITGLNFPEKNLAEQLESASTIFEMKSQSPTREQLKALPRVGDETADTLLVYLLKQPAIIVDGYLKRVLYRHFVIESQGASQDQIKKAIGKYIQTYLDTYRLHARLNEAGTLFCFAKEPNCGNCIFNNLPKRA